MECPYAGHTLERMSLGLKSSYSSAYPCVYRVKVFPDSVTQEFQHSINISTKTVGWEIHGISFYVQVAPIGVMCG